MKTNYVSDQENQTKLLRWEAREKEESMEEEEDETEAE